MRATMAPPKLVGVLVDQCGNEADVWYHPDEDHIVIMIGDSQDGDFVANQPCLLDPQQVRANEAYQSWRSTKSVARLDLPSQDVPMVDDEEVIEPFEPDLVSINGGRHAV